MKKDGLAVFFFDKRSLRIIRNYRNIILDSQSDIWNMRKN